MVVVNKNYFLLEPQNVLQFPYPVRIRWIKLSNFKLVKKVLLLLIFFCFKPFPLKGSPYFFMKIQRTISAIIGSSIMSTSRLFNGHCVVVFGFFSYALKRNYGTASHVFGKVQEGLLPNPKIIATGFKRGRQDS